ncbi:MAG: Oligopeptide transport system permease protein OppC [Opitutia bacterium UBA7350]|nr:MAG: Oligopeptide transport system permease protein OppC [Opitutae bacterium UBA7350]
MNKERREKQTLQCAGQSLERKAWKRLCRNSMARIGGVLFLLILLACLIGPFISDQDYATQDLIRGANPPSLENWLGTDELGRDLLERVLTGGRISIGVAFAATLVALLIGVSYGAIAGYCGKQIDVMMMRFVDVVYALPFTMLVVVLTVTFDQKSIFLIFLAIGAVEWLTMARIVRGQARNLRTLSYIEAARATGLSHWRILRYHILPNLLGVVIVYGTLTIPAVIMLESILSFLGLGVQPPASSWGTLINEGADKLDIYPWLLIGPVMFFSLTIFALNFLGDGLRDALDPREKDL